MLCKRPGKGHGRGARAAETKRLCRQLALRLPPSLLPFRHGGHSRRAADRGPVLPLLLPLLLLSVLGVGAGRPSASASPSGARRRATSEPWEPLAAQVRLLSCPAAWSRARPSTCLLQPTTGEWRGSP